MRTRRSRKRTDHSVSSFDSFLEQEGIREEVEAAAIKRVLAWQLEQAMRKQPKTNREMRNDKSHRPYRPSPMFPIVPGLPSESVAAVPVINLAPRLNVRYSNPH